MSVGEFSELSKNGRPFFCLDSKAKKHEAVRLRLMHRRCASYILMLDEQSSQAQNVLHKSLTMKHCFATAPQYEASPVFISLRRGKPFHSDMKHFAYAPYDLSPIALRATDDVRKWKMRVYPFAIQRYPHYIMTCNPVLYGWIFLYLDFTQRNHRHL